MDNFCFTLCFSYFVLFLTKIFLLQSVGELNTNCCTVLNYLTMVSFTSTLRGGPALLSGKKRVKCMSCPALEKNLEQQPP